MNDRMISRAPFVLLACMAFCPVLALAEDAPNDADGLQEVVVTAQKRAERAQDIGISITALSAKDIENQGIRDVTDVSRAAPSLQFNRFSESDVVINIRGVAQNDYGDQQEPPIAVYQDDSYASTLNLSGFPLFDLERVEVLRGPQGTLFGRNATGGAVQFISKKPTKNFAADITGTVGSFGEADAEGAISGPLSDHVQARLAFNSVNHAPYLKNLASVGGDRGGAKALAFRGELAFQSEGSLTGLLTVRYAHDGPDSDAGLYSTVTSYPDPTTGTGKFQYPGSPNPNPFGTCEGCDVTGYRNDAINEHLGGNPWTVNNYGVGRMNRTILGSSLHLDWNLDPVSFVSISDFQHLGKNYQEGDWGNNGIALVQFNQGNTTTQFTQELRASSTVGRNYWVAGVYFMDIHGRYAGTYSFPFFDYVPQINFTQNTVSGAIFGQDEFSFADGWKLIAGFRGWRDQRVFDYSAYDNTGAYPQTDPIVFNPTSAPGLARKIFKDYSTKLELDRQFSADVLGYLSFNRGTKSGGFEGPVATPAAGVEQEFIAALPYGTERLNAYELGVKSTLLNNKLRINGDVFHYDYAGYQAFEQIGLVQSIKNLTAKEWGAELEVQARPATGLTLSTSVSSLHSTVYNVTTPSLAVINTRLPQAPSISTNASVRYEHEVGTGIASIQLSGRYWSNFCWSAFCGQVDVEPPGSAFDGRVGYDLGKLNFAFSVTNLTNRRYKVYEVDGTAFTGLLAPIYAPPRWYLFSVTAKIGEDK